MKSLVICGKSRTGKTRLAHAVAEKLGYGVISTDFIRDSFRKVFPETGIKHGVGTDKERLTSFISVFMNKQHCATRRYVIEGPHLPPRLAHKYFSPDKFKIICLGTPTLTVEQAFNDIRKYDSANSYDDNTYDWTVDISDSELKDCLARWLAETKEWQKDCEELGILFIDTGINRQSKKDEFIKNLDEFLK